MIRRIDRKNKSIAPIKIEERYFCGAGCKVTVGYDSAETNRTERFANYCPICGKKILWEVRK